MSDDPKARPNPILLWQQGKNPDGDNQTKEQQLVHPQSPAGIEDSRDDLKEQASKFLDDEQIKDAPLERKLEFLETKGFSKEEIYYLLGQWREAHRKDAMPTIASEEGNWVCSPCLL